MVGGMEARVTRAEGFVGQRLCVLPQAMQDSALRRPGTRSLVVTACGEYPRAAGHGISRDAGVPEAVVLVCAAGRGWFAVGDTAPVPVRGGQAVLLPPATAHAYGSDDGDPWTIWWLHVAGSDVPDLLAAGPAPSSCGPWAVVDPLHAVGLIDRIITTMEIDSSERNLLAAAGAAWHLLAVLAADRGRHAAVDSPVDQAVAYLRDHYAAELSVAELARRAGLSASHFSARFRDQVGCTVGAFRMNLRMSAARNLLDTTADPVSEIAAAVGFSDPFYFSRRFRAVHGRTATSYRRLSKG